MQKYRFLQVLLTFQRLSHSIKERILFDSKNQFAKPVIAKAENIQLIEEAAIKVLGHQVKIRCIDVESMNSKLVKVKVEEKDEFVEKARSLAERLGVPLEIIDE